MYPKNVKDVLKQQPVNVKINFIKALLNTESNQRIDENREELIKRLDKLEKQLNEEINKQIDGILDILLDNLSE